MMGGFFLGYGWLGFDDKEELSDMTGLDMDMDEQAATDADMRLFGSRFCGVLFFSFCSRFIGLGQLYSLTEIWSMEWTILTLPLLFV